jgi:hypothetical protein
MHTHVRIWREHTLTGGIQVYNSSSDETTAAIVTESMHRQEKQRVNIGVASIA